MACNCSFTLGNTGVASCKNIQSVSKKIVFVPLYAEDGTKNQIDLVNDTLNAAYFTAKINDVDSSKRWYPSPLIDNVEDVRADSVFESLNSGENILVQDGARKFTGYFVKQTTQFMKKLKTFQCASFGVYIIDKEGNLIGVKDGDYLRPIEVNANTLVLNLIKTTDSTVQKIMVTFEYSQVEKDEDLDMITSSEAGTNLLLIEGLLDVNGTVSNDTVSGFTLTLKLDYGTALNKIPAKGWVLGNFSAYNNTTAGAVTLSGGTEITDGVYTFTHANQSGSDEIVISGTKTGYTFNSVTYTI